MLQIKGKNALVIGLGPESASRLSLKSTKSK